MAAGMTLPREHLDAFSAEFDIVARARIAPAALESVLLTDGELDGGDFCLDLAQQLRVGGPWGQAFPEPLFDGEFELQSWKIVGETHLRLVLRHALLAQPLSGIAFDAYRGTPPPSRLRLVYQLEVDEWNGTQRLQLLIRHLQPA